MIYSVFLFILAISGVALTQDTRTLIIGSSRLRFDHTEYTLKRIDFFFAIEGVEIANPRREFALVEDADGSQAIIENDRAKVRVSSSSPQLPYDNFQCNACFVLLDLRFLQITSSTRQ